MKKIIILLIISFTISQCQKKSEKPASDFQGINEIIEAIIVQDSLNVFKNNSDSNAFCIELKKITIEIPVQQKDGSIFPASFENIYITDLLNNKVNGEVFFSSKDSLKLLAQNSYAKKIKIDNSIIAKIESTTRENELVKRRKGQRYRFYEMTIPIFSLDNQKAYVELGYYCGGLCGNGKAFYLKKIRGKWTIVEKREIWMS